MALYWVWKCRRCFQLHRSVVVSEKNEGRVPSAKQLCTGKWPRVLLESEITDWFQMDSEILESVLFEYRNARYHEDSTRKKSGPAKTRLIKRRKRTPSNMMEILPGAAKT